MVSTVFSAALKGLKVEAVQVEADVRNGLPMFHMVGYLASEVKEAGERVRSAICNTEFQFPPKKIVVNLSPADVRKRGTAFDLPIAVSVLAALGQVQTEKLGQTMLIGELGLDGKVKKVTGVLPIVLAAKQMGFKACIVPEDNRLEGEIVEGIWVIGVTSMREACSYLNGEKEFVLKKRPEQNTQEHREELDFSDVQGQEVLIRAVEVAVAGAHNILMVGPPGAGKTMISRRIPTILPPLSMEESVELSSIYSIAGELDDQVPLLTVRPFREVHHSITKTALLGGGNFPKPGEITLANHGVLFLDELAEFPKNILELMRQPMDTHKIRIVRSRQECEFPANFLLVATMNPCPCGHYPDLNRCTCTGTQIQNHWNKISSPLMDRMDICVPAERVTFAKIKKGKGAESSEAIRQRVIRAREMQKERYKNSTTQTNAQMSPAEVETHCRLSASKQKMMEDVFQKMGLSMRAYHKILCVARTIADLSGEETISESHLSEAIGYRLPDRVYRGNGYEV